MIKIIIFYYFSSQRLIYFIIFFLIFDMTHKIIVILSKTKINTWVDSARNAV